MRHTYCKMQILRHSFINFYICTPSKHNPAQDREERCAKELRVMAEMFRLFCPFQQPLRHVWLFGTSHVGSVIEKLNFKFYLMMLVAPTSDITDIEHF